MCDNKCQSHPNADAKFSFSVRFLKETMNIIDMVAICPFYISLILEGLEDFEIIGKTGKMIRLVGKHKHNLILFDHSKIIHISINS